MNRVDECTRSERNRRWGDHETSDTGPADGGAEWAADTPGCRYRCDVNPPSKRQARLAEQHRRWADWAVTATTDTPPDVFSRQRFDPGSELSMQCGGDEFAPENLWWLDGWLVAEREWVAAERKGDPSRGANPADTDGDRP